MHIIFWGVRGSIPAPLTPREVTEKIMAALASAAREDLKDEDSLIRYVNRLSFSARSTYGGNTPCVEVSEGDTEIILDAGSGLRPLGDRLAAENPNKRSRTIHIFLSHCHWDHIQGFPFFAPAFFPGNHIFLYAVHQNAWDAIHAQQNPMNFPVDTGDMKASIQFIPLNPAGSLTIDKVAVDWIKLNHPGDSYAYRLKSRGKKLIYATDGEYETLSSEQLSHYIQFFSACDVLIFDAMYSLPDAEKRRGWGHSTASMGMQLALKAGVKKLVLYHHEPSYGDTKIEDICHQVKKEADKIKQNDLEIITAYEGLELSL
jgi:phosphoribosyl 1,2-cyclic phosphodiesterase